MSDVVASGILRADGDRSERQDPLRFTGERKACPFGDVGSMRRQKRQETILLVWDPSRDRDREPAVRAAIEEHGYEVVPGDPVEPPKWSTVNCRREVRRLLLRVGSVVLLVGRDTATSKWIRVLAEESTALGRPIVPIKVHSMPTRDQPDGDDEGKTPTGVRTPAPNWVHDRGADNVGTWILQALSRR